jgi:D-serine deaminase-like pyridoxal phosphate-dependent protein
MVDLSTLKTPALLLDAEKMKRNAVRMSERIRSLGAHFRPHVKTHKSVEIARIQTAGSTDHSGRIMVSTLAEAHTFLDAGFGDITYGVPVEPGKFSEVFKLSRKCEKFAVITDDRETVSLLGDEAGKTGVRVSVFLEIDTGDHRSGVAPDSEEAVDIARRICDRGSLDFAGILTHAGHSYNAPTAEERFKIACAERDLMRELAAKLAQDGIEVPDVSIGSTPTITCVDHLDGVTEVRPGNYIFFDAFQATLGSCSLADCALTVLAAVVHRSFEKRHVIIDAGAIALSKDRGAVDIDGKTGYGMVLDLDGNSLGLQVDGVSQEHGKIFVAPETETGDALLKKLPVGTRLRILANHSCLTAAQFESYNVLENGRVVDRWARVNGW